MDDCLYHISHLQGHAVLIDLPAVRLPTSREERNDFVLKDLSVQPATVANIFMVRTSQLLRLKFFEEEHYLSALERLQAGVPWAAAGGRLVYGWSIKESILAVRVSGCPRRVSVEKLCPPVLVWTGSATLPWRRQGFPGCW